jgi:putative ABC transport system permease protein
VTLGMAWRELRRSTLRSLLTTLGIVIGVSSVTLLVTLGRSASAQVQSQLSKLGTQLLVVVPTTRVRSGVSSPASPFHNADVHALRSAFCSGTRLAPTSRSKGSAVKGN